ncbi:MAG: UvrD-helicase domain-containing protein [Candidatus Omnitrophica bacterium]|nr:UvrD-helicase domain-containing protein [Candidatus Omnitrophota bacterium]
MEESFEIFLVEASAGSGKTYTLARRYLKLLIASEIPAGEFLLKSILAITFTNKAAFEMKARILDFLKKLALDAFESKKEKNDLLEYLNVTEEKARERASMIMESVIHHYNYFQVQTIDSFINAILSGCAFKLELSASFRIRQNYEDYLSYGFDALLNKAAEDPATRENFRGFLKNYLLVENKKNWFPRDDILTVIRILFGALNIYGKPFRKFPKGPGDISAMSVKIKDLMFELKRTMPEEANRVTWKKFIDTFTPDIPDYELDDFFGPFSKAEFSMRKNCFVTDEALKLWFEIKKSIGELYEWKSFSLFNCYVDIFEGVFENFKNISRKDDVMFLPELNSQAYRLFDEGVITVPELYYRLASRFRHYLIDEFQDTSVLQWRNLYPMIEDALSTGGSLFYVGDKKQAIYRFRGGDVSLIEGVKHDLHMFPFAPPEVLSKNYRSHKEIVEFNNTIFSAKNIRDFFVRRRVFQKNAFELLDQDIDCIIGIFAEARQEWKKENDKGFVKVERISGTNSDDTQMLIKEKVLGLLSRLTERFDYSDIAILARTNNQVEAVTSWLIEQGIPVESEKTLNIRENGFIREITAFLRFLNSPIDNLSFAVFIMGDIFTSISGIPWKEMELFLFSQGRLKEKNAGVYLYRLFRERYPDQWEKFFEGFFKSVGFIPLYELTVSIFNSFEVMTRFPGYQGFFMRFLEIIKEQEEEHQNIGDFLGFFDTAASEDLYVQVAGTHAIQALTVHKAKGLEFPVVIIPFFTIDVEMGAGESRGRSFVVGQEDGYLSLNHLKIDYTKFSPELEARYRDEFKKILIDELNNAYVALTRSKYELYVFIPPKSGSSVNIAQAFVPEEIFEFGTPGMYKKEHKEKTESVLPISPSTYRNWIDFLKDEFSDESAVKNSVSIRRGEMLHYLLSCIGKVSDDDDAGTVIASAAEHAKASYPGPEAREWNDICLTVVQLLKNKRIREFFVFSEGDVFQEKEVVDTRGNTRRIDRLIVKDKEILIVDYKSSRDTTKSHENQVREYACILKDIYAWKKIRGYLVYLDEMVLEEVII